ncbi:beta-L-arabinofuranosidase domain-containing protein [Microbacterium sp. SLBN-146]|uniref:beta-L-arabinofuranosidase domain-containing protein n=1 Tax=Microbacterium sp. SLBN-146 TaxID=2768457 RepID=UPI00114F475F|nr:beta-L-arabinofuranosidase domain-containing protein [Microbacterium sp. SLBN-146]TQJ30725.1 hypothetical protein FBY39_1182 [Microbacterium sp. SLBN-146]
MAALSVATAGALMLGAVSPAQAVDDFGLGDPVLELLFEDSVADSSPLAHPTALKGHNGSTTLNHTYIDGAKPGTKGLKLGGNTFLDLGTASELVPANLTLSFWFNPTQSMGSGEQLISWNKRAYNSDGWYVSSVSATNPLLFSFGAGTGLPHEVRAASTDRAGFFPVGQWTHITATYNSTTKEFGLYRNGVKVTTSIQTATNATSTGVIKEATPALPKTIGYNGPNYNGGYLTSALDDYRLYTGTADLAGIVALYEDGGGQVDRAALAAAAAETLTVPSVATSNLVLPTTASNGSRVVWSSDTPEVIGEDGTLVRPEAGDEDVTVTLTARVSYVGGPSTERIFEVVVPADIKPIEDTGLEDVELVDDYLVNAQQKEIEYLQSLDPERYLHWFRVTANTYKPGTFPISTTSYPGWENGSVTWNFRGHSFGHYMSALAMNYANTDDAETKAELLADLESIVYGLRDVQASYDGTSRAGYLGPFRDSALDAVEGRGTSDDQVIVPYYNLHKVLAGLLDAYEYVPGPIGAAALDVAEGFGEYMHGRVSTLTNTATLLGTEYGGMNEALYELFDVSGGNPHFKVAAEGFDEVSLFQSLANGQDVLAGRHANTTIPKFIGALKRYTVFTQNPEYYEMLTATEKTNLGMYLTAAQNFFDIVVDHHTYVTGANSQSEHFRAPDTLWRYATQQGSTGNPQTAETCNEYNMLKLARELFKVTQDVRYMHYYENTFINTILSSQNPDTGMSMYFNPMAPGYYKVYGPTPDQSQLFWCCVGTGMENFSKLADTLYFSRDKTVWVNLYFSSTYDHTDSNMRITQEANFPNDDTVNISVAAITGESLAEGATLRLRVPDWVAGDPVLVVNGETVSPRISGGYIVLDDVAAGDSIQLTTPMEVVAYDTADNADFVAFKYGPVVLSADLGTENMTGWGSVGVSVRIALAPSNAVQQSITVATPTTQAWYDNVAANVERIEDNAEGEVQFRLNDTRDGEELVYTPHYSQHGNRYGIYMNFEVPDSAASQQAILEEKQRLRASERFIDTLTTFDNNNGEAAKNLKTSGNTSVGVHNGRQYRHGNSGAWFSYDMAVDPSEAANYLETTYFSGDNGRSFQVYLNDELFKTQQITNAAGSGVFYEVRDQIPAKYLAAENVRYKVDANGQPVLDENGDRIPVITVRYQSTGSFVGGVFGVSTSRPAEYSTASTLSALSVEGGTLAPEFDRDTTSYVVSVPAGSTSVSFRATPNVPSGLVKFGDILVDDTQPRTVELEPGVEKTLTINSIAQDHVTTTAYTVVVREEVAAALDVETTVSKRCIAGKLILTVHVTNVNDVPVRVALGSAFGDKTWAQLAPGKSAAQAFTTRQASIAAGSMTIDLSGSIGGEEVTSSHTVEYSAMSCLAS